MTTAAKPSHPVQPPPGEPEHLPSVPPGTPEHPTAPPGTPEHPTAPPGRPSHPTAPPPGPAPTPHKPARGAAAAGPPLTIVEDLVRGTTVVELAYTGYVVTADGKHREIPMRHRVGVLGADPTTQDALGMAVLSLLWEYDKVVAERDRLVQVNSQLVQERDTLVADKVTRKGRSS